MNIHEELVESVELGVASIETQGIDPKGLEVTSGHRQTMGLSDLD